MSEPTKLEFTVLPEYEPMRLRVKSTKGDMFLLTFRLAPMEITEVGPNPANPDEVIFGANVQLVIDSKKE